MPGTVIGGYKTAITIKKKYGKNYYRKLGAIGGKATGRKGFAIDNRSWFEKLVGRKSRAQIAGANGGRISRKVKKYEL